MVSQGGFHRQCEVRGLDHGSLGILDCTAGKASETCPEFLGLMQAQDDHQKTRSATARGARVSLLAHEKESKIAPCPTMSLVPLTGVWNTYTKLAVFLSRGLKKDNAKAC